LKPDREKPVIRIRQIFDKALRIVGALGTIRALPFRRWCSASEDILS
jgi:hypothetical protein